MKLTPGVFSEGNWHEEKRSQDENDGPPIEVQILQTCMKCCNKIYNCNLQIFVINKSACPWQAFLAFSNVCG